MQVAEIKNSLAVILGESPTEALVNAYVELAKPFIADMKIINDFFMNEARGLKRSLSGSRLMSADLCGCIDTCNRMKQRYIDYIQDKPSLTYRILSKQSRLFNTISILDRSLKKKILNQMPDFLKNIGRYKNGRDPFFLSRYAYQQKYLSVIEQIQDHDYFCQIAKDLALTLTRNCLIWEYLDTLLVIINTSNPDLKARGVNVTRINCNIVLHYIRNQAVINSETGELEGIGVDIANIVKTIKPSPKKNHNEANISYSKMASPLFKRRYGLEGWGSVGDYFSVDDLPRFLTALDVELSPFLSNYDLKKLAYEIIQIHGKQWKELAERDSWLRPMLRRLDN